MTNGSEAAAALGAAIRARRRELGLSAREVARLCLIDLTHFQRIERGATNPTLHMLLRISHSLETTLAELVTGLDGLALPEKDPAAITQREFLAITGRTQENSTDE